MKTLCLWMPVFVLLATTPAVADEEATQLKALMDAHAESICTVKVVIRTEMGGFAPPSEDTQELRGVVVTSSGLVLMSNAPLDQDISGPMGLQVKTTPLSFKVVFGNEEKEYAAFLATKDSELGLAFVQIENLEGRQCKALSFDDSSKPEIGEKVATISRLGRGFDYATFFATGRIAGKIKKPRKAYMVDGGASSPGLPIFTISGKLVGVMTTLQPTVQEGGGGGMGGLMSMLSGIAGPTFVIPARTIASKIKPAVEEANRVRAERKKAEEGSGASDTSGESGSGH